MLSELAREYHAAHPARYERRVQLRTDLDSMPVEDASIPWDEQVSPYRRVATIINRLRHNLYRQLGQWRHQTHATAEHNPTRLEEVPN